MDLLLNLVRDIIPLLKGVDGYKAKPTAFEKCYRPWQAMIQRSSVTGHDRPWFSAQVLQAMILHSAATAIHYPKAQIQSMHTYVHADEGLRASRPLQRRLWSGLQYAQNVSSDMPKMFQVCLPGGCAGAVGAGKARNVQVYRIWESMRNASRVNLEVTDDTPMDHIMNQLTQSFVPLDAHEGSHVCTCWCPWR